MLARAILQLDTSVEKLVPCAQLVESKNIVMQESRSILHLTKYIDTEPWTPIW